MLIIEIPFILILLSISVFSTSQELLGLKSKYLKASFIIVSSGLLYFSFTYNLLCSDYYAYASIYKATDTSESIERLIGIDKAFVALSVVWQSFFSDYDFSLFLRVYQTIGLGLIIFSISRLSGAWSNTILYLITFGSLQFYHLNLCTSRQGFSSGFVAIIFALAIKSSNSKINFVNPSNLTFIGLVLLSIYFHWTGIIMGIFLYLAVAFSNNYKPHNKNLLNKLFSQFRKFFIIIILIGLIFYFGSYSSESERLNLYLLDKDAGYGSSIPYTFFADVIFLVMTFYHIKTSRNKLGTPESQVNISSEYSPNSFPVTALILITGLSLFFKLLAFLGYGTTIRIIIQLTSIQYLLLPVILQKTKTLIRFIIVFLLSSPYLYFIFFVSKEEFLWGI